MNAHNSPVVIVTGGSRGIGRAIVEKLAEDGNRVVFTYLNSKNEADNITSKLRANGKQVYPYRVDVVDSRAVTEFIDETGNKFKSVDALVNCAGITRDNPLYLIDDEDWSQVLETNLYSAFYTCRAASRFMIRQRRGRIVNISSVSARRGGRGQVNYCASKGGLESFSRSLAVELSSKNITVNCIAPGVIKTDMTKNIIRDHEARLLDAILLGRFGKAAEVAQAASFLLESDYITGQVLHVDGGMSLA